MFSSIDWLRRTRQNHLFKPLPPYRVIEGVMFSAVRLPCIFIFSDTYCYHDTMIVLIKLTENSLASTDDLIRFWRSKVQLQGHSSRRDDDCIHVDAGVS